MEPLKRVKKEAKTSPFRGKVLSSLLEEQAKDEKVIKSEEVKQKRAKAFNKIYDKLKHWQPSKTANMKTFVSLPKELFTRNWLSLPALAVYPVICAGADYERESWIQLSLENLKKKTGLSIPTIQKAIEELCSIDFPIEDLLKRRKHTEGQRTYWIYNPQFIRADQIHEFKGEQFFFYSYLVESGVWRKLDRRAKALYLAMRSTAVFDFLEYCTAEDITYGDPSEEVYKNRKWEVCRTSLAELCRILNISPEHVSDVIRQLIRYNLVEKIDDGYIVFFLPSDVEAE